MGRRLPLWVAKYGDGVVLLAYAVGLAFLLFDLPGAFDPAPGAVSRRTFVALTTGAFLATGLHLLYVAVYIARNTETAIEERVKPVTTTLGRGYVHRYVRRVMDYGTEREAQRAADHLLVFGVAAILLAAAGWIVVA